MGSIDSTTAVEQTETPNLDLARDLRETADWLEAHPELPKLNAWVSAYPWGDDGRDVLSAVAAALGDKAVESCERDRVQIEGMIGRVRVRAETNVVNLGGSVPFPPVYEPIIEAAKR